MRYDPVELADYLAWRDEPERVSDSRFILDVVTVLRPFGMFKAGDRLPHVTATAQRSYLDGVSHHWWCHTEKYEQCGVFAVPKES